MVFCKWFIGKRIVIIRDMKKGNKKYKYIDLFAGIGGFHQAFEHIGCKCVFASEIDEDCKKTYENQFNMKVHGDINKHIDDIPSFDILCGGFPCQTFSKAGKQKGFSDKERGQLFYTVIDILIRHPECKFILLENVKNLADNEKFWDVIQKNLSKLNYFVTKDPIVLSPADFGIPQNRERVYILGVNKNICNTDLLENKAITKQNLDINKYLKKCTKESAFQILENNKENSLECISDDENNVILAWEEFKKEIIPDVQIGAPIWIDYMNIKKNPNRIRLKSDDPDWKRDFVNKNRKLYALKRKEIDKWYERNKKHLNKKIYRKFEWNCGPKYISFKKCVLQFRQSGLRIKKADTFPSLVAIVNVPIIWDDKIKKYRRITIREAGNLQSFDKNFKFINRKNKAYKQLGNSVNVKIIELIATELLKFEK